MLADAMLLYIKENSGVTVMGLRDGLREWRVNDCVYCFDTTDGDKVFCIQDVSWDFYVSLRRLCATGRVQVADGTHAARKQDPYMYHDLVGAARYLPLCLFSHADTNVR